MKLSKLLVVLGVVAFSSSVNAKVASMSGEQSFVDSNGVSTSKVTVKCSGNKVAKTLIRASGQWCDSVVTDLCNRQKLKAAKSVCGFTYKKMLAEQGSSGNKPAPAVAKAKVEKAKPVAKKKAVIAKTDTASSSEQNSYKMELAEIEKEQALIRKRQAELRNIELELQKQKAATGS